MLKVLVPLCVMLGFSLGCESCGASQTATTAVSDTFKCAVQYPADTLTQAMQLARTLSSATSPEQYAVNLVAWAEGAKDSQFAMCVLTTIENDIIKKNSAVKPSSTAAALFDLTQNPDPVVQAIEQFRKKKFGSQKFEAPTP